MAVARRPNAARKHELNQINRIKILCNAPRRSAFAGTEMRWIRRETDQTKTMKMARYTDNEFNGSDPRSGLRPNPSPPVVLAALRQAEAAHWNALGGDYLDRRYQPGPTARVTSYKALGGGWEDEPRFTSN